MLSLSLRNLRLHVTGQPAAVVEAFWSDMSDSWLVSWSGTTVFPISLKSRALLSRLLFCCTFWIIRTNAKVYANGFFGGEQLYFSHQCDGRGAKVRRSKAWIKSRPRWVRRALPQYIKRPSNCDLRKQSESWRGWANGQGTVLHLAERIRGNCR